jgi:hypothetical protein
MLYSRGSWRGHAPPTTFLTLTSMPLPFVLDPGKPPQVDLDIPTAWPWYPHQLISISPPLGLDNFPAPDKYLTLKICINVGRAYWVVVVNDDFRCISHGRVVFRDVQYQNQLDNYDFDGNKLTVIYKRCMCRVF